MNTADRKYFIDWIRVIAIGLLIIYHVAIGFQKWGIMIGFITNSKTWDSLWIPMSMLNIWRIPLLFFISGMGVYFAMKNRTWIELIGERARRIFIPYLFGMCCIVPIHIYIWRKYYNFEFGYTPEPGHLWFLGNIMSYVVLLLPLLYFMKNNTRIKSALETVFKTPLGLVIVVGLFLAEAYLVKPVPYEFYAMTIHGFVLGLLSFLAGYCFVQAGSTFWPMIVRWRWLFLLVAASLYLVRMKFFVMQAPYYLLIPESQCWIFTVLAFGCKYLNKPGPVLSYLSQAAYPVYILHMIFLYLGSYFLFPTSVPVVAQFVLVILITLAGCFLVFEFFIRRIRLVGFLFGVSVMKKQPKPESVLQ